jgi:hypothetical protein
VDLIKFATWRDVLEWCAAGKPVYYQAPLDYRPTRLLTTETFPALGRVPYTYQARARTICIFPPGCIGRGKSRTSDPFSADAKHLGRFSHEAQA